MTMKYAYEKEERFLLRRRHQTFPRQDFHSVVKFLLNYYGFFEAALELKYAYFLFITSQVYENVENGNGTEKCLV